MVATGQEIVRERKIPQGRGNVREFYSASGKIGFFEEKSGKIEIVRLMYSAKRAAISTKTKIFDTCLTL